MAAVTETTNPLQMRTKAQVRARCVKSLASAYRRSEHVGVETIIIAELKLGDVQGHIFTAHLVARPISPAIRIQRGV
jgi:hypothetical protein